MPSLVVPYTLLIAALGVVALVFVTAWLVVRRRHRRKDAAAPVAADVPPALHLRAATDDTHVLPAVIQFPLPGKAKLRVGYHPPYMDRHVGRQEFRQLPYIDVRADAPAARELSRHAACIWRDPGGDCYVQLGWPGPGESIRPRNQTRVLRFGRPHDATSQPFRLAHRDVVRLSANVDYIFLEVEALRDRPTPEQKKIDAFESSTVAPSSSAKLSLIRRGPAAADDSDPA